MTEKVNFISKYICNTCNKIYSSQSSLCNHNKKFHKENVKNVVNSSHNVCNNVVNSSHNVCNNVVNCLTCKFCNKSFQNRSNRWRHEKKCVIQLEENNKIKEENNKIKELEETINELKKQVSTILQEKGKIHHKTLQKQPSINNQLINLIVDKTNTIQELKTKIDKNKTNNDSLIEINNNTQLKQNQTLKLNDIIIISRSEDNYINGTQLCQAGDKLFADWFRLNTTKQLLTEAESDMGIPISQLIDIKKGNSNEFQQGSWIHPDLAYSTCSMDLATICITS